MTQPKKPAAARKRVSAAERKRRAAQKPDQPAETPVEEQPADDKPIDGLVVARLPAGDGVNFGTNVVCIGDVRATEIGDLLALALRNHRKHTDPE